MALVVPFYDRRPSHPLGNLSLGATQRRTPADTSGTRLWLPSDLTTTPKAWLDADSLSGADASTVTTFTDRMVAFDATLAAGTGPVLRYSSQNGLKTVEFSKASAAQMTMSSSLMNGATAGAYFAVFKLKADPTTDSANGGDVGAVLDAFTSDTSVPASHHPFSDSNFYDHFGVTARQTLGDPTPSFSASHRLFNCEVTSGGTYTNRIDATQFFQATGQTVGFGAKTRNLAWTNAGGSALYYLNGYVAEVLVLDAVPSASDQAKLEGYLAWKWGLQGNLPIGHVYAAAAPRITTSTGSTGTGASTEDADTTAASGTVAIAITGASTETADTCAGNGALSIAGTGASTENTDTTSASGTVAIAVSGASIEGADTTAGAGAVTASATGASTEGTDTTSAAGTVAVAASGASTESSDTGGGAGAVSIAASGASTESTDTTSAAGAVSVTGSGAGTEATDTASAAGAAAVAASGAATEGTDNGSGSATAAQSGSTGTGTCVETDDATSGAGLTLVSGTGSALEALDTCAGIGSTLSISFGHVKLWMGTGFVAKPVKFWSGTGWVEKPLKYWTGTAWRATSY